MFRLYFIHSTEQWRRVTATATRSREYIQNDLPESFFSCKISEMYDDLQQDICQFRTRSPDLSQNRLEMMLHQRHEKLAFSYPGLFFRIVRGEVDPVMLNSLLKLEENLADNNVTLGTARNRVIDCAKSLIDETKDQPKKAKSKAAGIVVQELSFRCRPDA